MDMQENAPMKEPQVKKLLEELFKAIAETDEQAGQLASRLVSVMQAEPPDAIDKEPQQSGSCEMSEQLIRAISQISSHGNRLATMRNRLEI